MHTISNEDIGSEVGTQRQSATNKPMSAGWNLHKTPNFVELDSKTTSNEKSNIVLRQETVESKHRSEYTDRGLNKDSLTVGNTPKLSSQINDKVFKDASISFCVRGAERAEFFSNKVTGNNLENQSEFKPKLVISGISQNVFGGFAEDESGFKQLQDNSNEAKNQGSIQDKDSHDKPREDSQRNSSQTGNFAFVQPKSAATDDQNQDLSTPSEPAFGTLAPKIIVTQASDQTKAAGDQSSAVMAPAQSTQQNNSFMESRSQNLAFISFRNDGFRSLMNKPTTPIPELKEETDPTNSP